MKELDCITIYGCGGHARSIISTIKRDEKDKKILIVDENASANEVIMGCATTNIVSADREEDYIIAVGNNSKRRQMYEKLNLLQGKKCVSIISERAIVGQEVEIGEGTFVAPNAYIGPQVHIGINSIVNTGSILEHEVTVGDFSHIAPGTVVCGRTHIGDNVFVGAGSTIIDSISICDNAIIGAGSLVIDNVSCPGVYVGRPAKQIK